MRQSPRTAVIKQIRKRRGRPRIEGKTREPNGRISRAKAQREPIDLLAIKMRAKHHSLSLVDAKNPLAATYIGRLYLKGYEEGISQNQYDAAQKYMALYQQYLRAKGLPGAHYENTGCPVDEATHLALIKQTEKKWKAARDCLRDAQFDNPGENIYAAIQYLILEDRTLPHLLGPLRIALNHLHRHFFLTEATSKILSDH
ncbi:hypothetical protein [Bartonella sp. DGB2]|uniref:hypothetical protein n=1 Tax=Bartonella sp. DGB2 TaxID=3388426 RepID=UPI00398FE6B7